MTVPGASVVVGGSLTVALLSAGGLGGRADGLTVEAPTRLGKPPARAHGSSRPAPPAATPFPVDTATWRQRRCDAGVPLTTRSGYLLSSSARIRPRRSSMTARARRLPLTISKGYCFPQLAIGPLEHLLVLDEAIEEIGAEAQSPSPIPQ